MFPKRRVIQLLAAIACAITFFIANVNPAAANGVPAKNVPADGVPIYNARVCGTDWVDIHIPNASYYNVYNDDFGRETCVVAELHHLDFRISSAGNSYGFDAYPNISSGWEDNKYTCTGHAGECFTYPVRADHDGDPVTRIAGWLFRSVRRAKTRSISPRKWSLCANFALTSGSGTSAPAGT